MPKAWKDMLDWLAKTYADPSGGEAHLDFRELEGATSEDVVEDGDQLNGRCPYSPYAF